uniref:Uncharacterized protein n=1 Tax=Arundo donax TaxID=35708 RepID=A0A0A9HU07_ARUDO
MWELIKSLTTQLQENRPHAILNSLIITDQKTRHLNRRRKQQIKNTLSSFWKHCDHRQSPLTSRTSYTLLEESCTWLCCHLQESQALASNATRMRLLPSMRPLAACTARSGWQGP